MNVILSVYKQRPETICDNNAYVGLMIKNKGCYEAQFKKSFYYTNLQLYKETKIVYSIRHYCVLKIKHGTIQACGLIDPGIKIS